VINSRIQKVKRMANGFRNREPQERDFEREAPRQLPHTFVERGPD
jgi:hypothetical protein